MSHGMSMDEIFSEAVERLLAGEPLSTIVASYPPESQPELRQLLVVIEMTEQLKTQPVPQPSAVRRRATRAMFLEEAAARRTEMNEVLGMPPEAAAIPAAASPWHALLDRAREFWNALFDVPIMRLAPLALVFLAVYLATFGVVSAAKAALPGDAAYPFKQWIRDQRVALAPPDQRIKAVQDVEEEVADEMEALAHEQRDRSSLLTEHSQRLIYYGQVGKLMRLGPLLVAPNYQPDANSETLEPAVIEGILEPGVTVELVYKMLPGNPSVVQGKSLRVIDLPRPTPPPTSTPLPPANCQRAIPQTWVPYPVQPGMTLAELADRSGATAARLAAVNCLPDGRLPAGENVFVPDNFYVSVTPTNLPTPVPTVPPTPIPMATPVPPPTVTPSPEPPTTEPTEVPTGDATLEPTGEPTTAPTEQATSQPTGEPTNAPTNAPTGEATAEPTPEPTLGATETVVATLTSAPTALPGDETTPTAEATAAAAPTAAAGATPAPVEATPVTTAEPEATSAAGEGGDGATPTSTPVDQVTPATQREPTPTRQPTVDPTQAPPTATPLPPPTAAPPTPVPPPPEPPPPTSPPASNESTGDASPGGVAAGGPAPVEVPSETAP